MALKIFGGCLFGLKEIWYVANLDGNVEELKKVSMMANGLSSHATFTRYRPNVKAKGNLTVTHSLQSSQEFDAKEMHPQHN